MRSHDDHRSRSEYLAVGRGAQFVDRCGVASHRLHGWRDRGPAPVRLGHLAVFVALIGGAAVLTITQRAPVFAAVFTAELTHPPQPIWGMLLLAAVGAH